MSSWLRCRKSRRRCQENALEVLQNFRTVRAFGREEKEKQSFHACMAQVGCTLYFFRIFRHPKQYIENRPIIPILVWFYLCGVPNSNFQRYPNHPFWGHFCKAADPKLHDVFGMGAWQISLIIGKFSWVTQVIINGLRVHSFTRLIWLYLVPSFCPAKLMAGTWKWAF